MQKRRIVSLDQRIDDEINGRLDLPQLRTIGPHELAVGGLTDFITPAKCSIKTTVDDGQRTCLPIKRTWRVARSERREPHSQIYVGWAPAAYVEAAEACRTGEVGSLPNGVPERPALAG